MHINAVGDVDFRELWDEPLDTQSKDMWTAYQQLKDFMLDLDKQGHTGLRVVFCCFDEGVLNHLSRHLEGDLIVDLDPQNADEVDLMCRRLAHCRQDLTISTCSKRSLVLTVDLACLA